MAGRTIGWEVGRFVIGVGGCGIIIFVTRKAIGWSIVVIIVNVASRTVFYVMPKGQREEIVVQDSWGPSRVGSVTYHAIRWEICSFMIGIGGGYVIVLMACKAIGWGIGIIAIDVASRTVFNVVP